MPGFVGREKELGALSLAMDQSLALVLVSGEAGIGKSRLISEFIASPAGRSRKTLMAVCPPFRDPCTLGPVSDALRLAVGDVASLRLSGLGGALRPLFPEWTAELPPAPEPLGDATAERFRLFRALAEVIGRLEVAVLVVEDAHLADDGTLEFLAFLAARVAPRVTLLVTVREEGPRLPSMLLRLSSRQTRGAPVARIGLTGLSAEATADLVASMLTETRISPEFASFLHKHTDGIPLAIEESVRLLYDRHDLICSDGDWGRRYLTDLAVPPTFRDAVLERAARLSDEALRVLQASAVLSVPASEPVLGEMGGIAGVRLRDGVIAALEAGLLCEDRPGLLRFRHSLAGRAVYDAIPPPLRRDLHALAGELLGRGHSPPKAPVARAHPVPQPDGRRPCKNCSCAAARIGPVYTSRRRRVGDSVNCLCRMLDAWAARKALAGSGAELACANSGCTHQPVVRRHPSLSQIRARTSP